jgi:ribonuclease inhibitor
MKIVIEGQDMKNINDFHLYLKETLGFPEYYGMNLDALWDMLTGWVDLPLTIEWKNFESSENNLGEDAFRILDVFKEAEQEIDGFKLVFN